MLSIAKIREKVEKNIPLSPEEGMFILNELQKVIGEKEQALAESIMWQREMWRNQQ
jgi:uncharacterized protein YdhG (YjbR/CyaY superfamily)